MAPARLAWGFVLSTFCSQMFCSHQYSILWISPRASRKWMTAVPIPCFTRVSWPAPLDGRARLLERLYAMAARAYAWYTAGRISILHHMHRPWYCVYCSYRRTEFSYLNCAQSVVVPCVLLRSSGTTSRILTRRSFTTFQVHVRPTHWLLESRYDMCTCRSIHGCTYW